MYLVHLSRPSPHFGCGSAAVTEAPQWPTGPRYEDEVDPVGAGPASSSTRGAFPASIVLGSVFGTIVICVATLLIAAAIVSYFWGSRGGEGEGLAVVALFFIALVAVGPAVFAALFTWMMRRNHREQPVLLGVVAAVGLLPALVIGAWGIAKFTQNRGLRVTGLVVVLIFGVLALGWVLAAAGHQSLRVAMLGTLISGVVLAFTITAANLNADAHDRALERQAISGENAPLALFDPRGALAEQDGWRIIEVETIHVDRSRQYGRLGLRLESSSEQIVSVDFRSTDEGGYCSPTTTCQPLLTLDDGTVVHGEPGPGGTRFDFPAPRNQGWWTLFTNASLTATDLTEVVALLQPVTVDAWIQAQPRFDN